MSIETHSSADAKVGADNSKLKLLSEQTRREIDHWVAKFPPGRQRSACIAALRATQEQNNGYLTAELMDAVAEYLKLPPIQVYEVASFYSMFYLKPVGENVIQVCTTSPCELRGARGAVECFKKKLHINVGETTPDGKFTLMEVECLAACDRAPMAQINEDYYLDIDEKRCEEIVAALSEGRKPPYAEFEKNLKGAHPIAFSDEELGIDVSGIQPAPPVEKKPKPAPEEATPAKA